MTSRNILLDLAERIWLESADPAQIIPQRLLLIGGVLGNERMICVACDVARVFFGGGVVDLIAAFARGQGVSAEQIRAAIRPLQCSALEWLLEATVHRYESTRFVAKTLESAFDAISARQVRQSGRHEDRAEIYARDSAMIASTLVESVPWSEMMNAILRLDSRARRGAARRL